MISRQASSAIAQAYTSRFSGTQRMSYGVRENVHGDSLYDFLYNAEYEPWFCNKAKKLTTIRGLKEFFLKIHTGESLATATQEWTWKQRQSLGQRLLKDLAKDYLRWADTAKDDQFMRGRIGQNATEVIRRLELDGYLFENGELLQQQSDVVNVEEERSVLSELYTQIGLQRGDDAIQFLKLSEEHFVAERWSDCISNSRKFFELTLSEGARALMQIRGDAEQVKDLDRPVRVREYLENVGLFEKKEREALDKLYGLLSETGAHPYMAESDQARLMRQLSLTIAQFALLRLRFAVKAA